MGKSDLRFYKVNSTAPKTNKAYPSKGQMGHIEFLGFSQKKHGDHFFHFCFLELAPGGDHQGTIPLDDVKGM